MRRFPCLAAPPTHWRTRRRRPRRAMAKSCWPGFRALLFPAQRGFKGGFAATLPRISCRSDNLVVVTRERGKNAKLVKALLAHDIQCLELPLIEHSPGPDQQKLPLILNDNSFQWIVVTSPEAAAVFIDGWKSAGFPKVQVAVVGKGTREAFDGIDEGKGLLEVGFVPSQANAKVLATELPKLDGKAEVLYPASVKASDELAKGLAERGFEVCRLNTYSTESVQRLQETEVATALKAPVVTFASPTAVKAWVELVLSTHSWNGAAACIGSTSAVAARKAGMQKVFCPESPGLDGWVESTLEALKSMQHHVTTA